ncbi:hypothetical protein BJY04DRAFT_176365 [Aspergillus karnatakaensis]|uniref:uncharacterized protein n=1 Tax=Aspergillus karnatakaensis TaxID=1810916 RepID=UPI003CCE3627
MAERDPYVFKNHSSTPPEILRVITTVLSSWDGEETDYEYVKMFNPDGGVLDVHTTPAKGHDEIHALRAQMINPVDGPVVKVQHHVDTLFIAPGHPEGGKVEVVFNGTLVTYLKNGEEISTDYTSLVRMSPGEGGQLRADYWRAFLDRSNVAEAIGKMFTSQ